MTDDKNLLQGLDPSFAGALRLQQAVTGGNALGNASSLESQVPIIPCPLAWGWAAGGVNGMPLIGAIGCDSKSGYGKSTLAYEHIRWTLMAGGLGVYIGNEERPNPQYMRSVMSSIPFSARVNLIPIEVQSIDGWTKKVFDLRKKSQKFLDKTPEERVPMTVVVDSLTGRGTAGEQRKAEKEGIKARDFSEAAMSISRFYKNFSFQGHLMTLFHIQHAKKSQSDDAYGDDQWVANGGDEPRFNANYHFRITGSSDFSYAAYQGRDMRVKFIKSFIGPSKRQLMVRVCWRFEWMELPLYTMYGDGEEVVYEIEWEEEQVAAEQAMAWWEKVNAHIPIELAVKLGMELQIFAWKEHTQKLEEPMAQVEEARQKLAEAQEEKDKRPSKQTLKKLEKEVERGERLLYELNESAPPLEVPMPKTEQQKVQFTWFDWDHSLGWLLVDWFTNKENSKVPASERHDLLEILPFITSGCNKGYAKCKALFSDNDPHAFTEIGKALRGNPELYRKVENFLGIKRRMHFRDVPQRKKALAKGKK